MKKIFTSFLMLMALLCSNTALAGSGLSVCGIEVNTEATTEQTITGSAITAGKVTYQPNNKTLLLDNATLICNYEDGIYNYGVEGLYILLRGTVKISVYSNGWDGACIRCLKATTISSGLGDTAPPTVTLENRFSGPAIKSRGAKITISDVNLTASSKLYNAIDGIEDNGNKPSLRINYSRIKATGASNYRAITGFTGGMDLNLSVLSENTSIDAASGSIVNSNNSAVNETEVFPGITIGTVHVGSIYSWKILSTFNTGASTAEGLYNYSSVTKTLTLENVKIDGATIVNRIPDLTIEFKGNAIISSSSWTLDLYGNTTLKGNGVVNITSTDKTAVYINNASNLTISLPELQVQSKSSAYSGIYGRAGSSLTLNKYNDDCIYKIVGGYSNICIPKLIMNDMDISTGDTYWNPSDGYVYYKDQIDKGTNLGYGTWFKATSKISYYNLWVGGTHVKQNNTKYITSPNMDKIVSYDSSTQTLKMDEVTINMPGHDNSQSNAIIYSMIKDLNINATGNNNWTSNRFGLNLGGSGTTTITGSGTLNVTSNESTALNTFGTTSITMERSNGIAAFQGKIYAYLGKPSTTLLIKKTGVGAIYKFAGETANFANLPSLSLGNGVRVSTSYMWYNDDAQTFYYKDAVAKASDVSDGSATWIRANVEWTDYPIYICGTQLYSGGYGGNINGVWNKYVKGGDIYYTPSTKTLTLKGVKMDREDVYWNCIFSQQDSLVINVVGTNELRSETGYGNYSPLRLDGNTTIQGTGSISLTGGAGSISSLDADHTITIDDVNIDISENVMGGGGTLAINMTTPGKKMTVKGKVYMWGSIALGDNTQITQPEGAYISGGSIHYAYGDYANNIVIQKVEPYDLTIAGCKVTSTNCNDIFGDGVFSYDNQTRTLTISGDYTYDDIGSFIESDIDQLIIKVDGSSTLQSTSPGSMLFLRGNTTITGDMLRLVCTNPNEGLGIYLKKSNTMLTLDHAQLAIEGEHLSFGITGEPSLGTKLCINYSDVTISPTTYGTIYDWKGITLTGCWVIEPYPSQILDKGIADEHGIFNGGIFISSDPDVIDAVSQTEAVRDVYDVYDLSGRKLSQAGSGVNIVRTKDGRTTKVLRK